MEPHTMTRLFWLCSSVITAAVALAHAGVTHAATVIDAKDAGKLIRIAEDNTGASLDVVSVQGQSFKNAVRARVTKPTDPVWSVQLLSQASRTAVKAGDTLVVRYSIKGQGTKGSTPGVRALFQKMQGQYELLGESKTNPSDEWQQHEIKAVASKDYPAGALTVTFHLGSTPQTVEIGGVDVRVQTAGSTADASTDAPDPGQTLIDGRVANRLNAIAEPGSGATVSVAGVQGQPFRTAVRAEVTRTTDPVWAVQVLSQGSAFAVAPGDKLRGSYYIRAEPVNGSTPTVVGYFQKTKGTYEQLAYLDPKPTANWQKRTFEATANKVYAPGDLTVSFHLGSTPQVVEIAAVHVTLHKASASTRTPGAPPTRPNQTRTTPPTEPARTTGAPPTQAVPNPIDPALLQRLGPNAKLLIAGNRPAALSGPGPAPGATLDVVAVSGEDFQQAARVHVPTATDPVWNAQLTTPASLGAIKSGDVLYGLIDVRGESRRESGGAQFTAWLQAPGTGDTGVKAPNGETRTWTELRKLDGAPGPRWSRRFFSVTATQDFAPGEVNLAFHLGVIPQTVDVANVLLWNLGPDADTSGLSHTRLTYEGQDPDAPWRVEAMRRIDQHRKADLTVEVSDRTRRPIPNAEVHVELTRHAFGFGTFLENDSPVLQDSADARRFVDVLTRYHNRLTTPSYAAQTWGWPDPATADRYTRTAQWAVDHGFLTKAHTVVWSRFDWSPSTWSAARDDPRQLRRAMETYIRDVMTRLNSLGVQEIEFWNEPASFQQIEQTLTDPALRADLFKLGQSLAPNTKLIINEHTILSAGGLNTARQDAYFAIIQDLLDRGAPVAGIGMQAHMGEDFTPPAKIWEILDRFAEFHLPIQITEFDLNTEDELTQAEYTRDFYLALLAHPSVNAITSWGFWEPVMWVPGAEMWRQDWTIKPNGEAFHKLLTDTLHTDERTTTDRAGSATVRGFHGQYLVTVTHNGKRVTQEATLDRDGETLRITLD
ncbi:MAG: endo-1,4-beta-xylanase [Planctomycetota bacterium]